MSRLLAEALAIAAKDLRTEFRTRVALNALGLFAITVLAAVSYTVGPYRITAEDRPFLLAVLLWIVVFFAALAGLDRSFVKEEESHTASLLRLAASPTAVWLGKLGFNLIRVIALRGKRTIAEEPLDLGPAGFLMAVHRPLEFFLRA